MYLRFPSFSHELRGTFTWWSVGLFDLGSGTVVKVSTEEIEPSGVFEGDEEVFEGEVGVFGGGGEVFGDGVGVFGDGGGIFGGGGGV